MFGHLDPANHFAMEGLNMAFAAELTREGKPPPKMFFYGYYSGKNPDANKSY